MDTTENAHDVIAPREVEVENFWEEARKVIGLTRLDVIIGTNPTAVVEPPAWQFFGDRKGATELAALVVAGEKTATSSLKAEYDAEDEPLPEVGTLGIACDGAGIPVALVRTDSVDIVPFDEVDEDFARAEGEGFETVDDWRRAHFALIHSTGIDKVGADGPDDGVWPKDDMVLERLTCIYPEPRARSRKYHPDASDSEG